ncbi:hypothetical protein [uncultured Fusobacterium sp.]|uniref:hypothetical protein n=1 Tax=uncultured Fusobacterium sp. TaxID=159267 RepID=UPI0027DD56FB|nr:hypothetical protein [uncultured Fusobacterium sp.]
MDINIKKNNTETIILKTVKEEKKKHIKIWICIYTLITIFVQYSILKTLKIKRIPLFTFESIPLQLFVQVLLSFPIFLGYNIELVKYWDEFIIIDNLKITLQSKDGEYLKSKSEFLIKDIIKIYIKKREEIFKYDRHYKEEDYKIIKIETKEKIYCWGYDIQIEEAKRVLNILNNIINKS